MTSLDDLQPVGANHPKVKDTRAAKKNAGVRRGVAPRSSELTNRQ
jgi:hypothetical protein